jgi:hypothetical protein
LGVGRKASNLAPEKNPIPLKMLNYGKPDGRIIDDQSEYRGIRKKRTGNRGRKRGNNGKK